MTIFPALKAAVAASAAISSPGIDAQDPAATNNTGKQNPSYFNPQISVVGDFAGRLRDKSGEARKWDFREIEIGIAADADPFLKVEAYLAFAKEDGEIVTDVEEAFGRYDRLGNNLSAKFGKFKAAVGRVQRNHGHAFNFLELPMVLKDTLGEEGLQETGLSLSYLFPGSRYQELTIEAVDAGSDGPVFNNSSGNDPLFVGHYRTFFDFDDCLSAQLGITGISGPTVGLKPIDGTGDGSRGDMFGTDLTMKWTPGNVGKTAVLEAEAYWTKPFGGAERSFGAFARLTYELMPRWFVTGGWDTSEIPGTTDKHRSTLLGLTMRPTEFQHWRLEFQDVRSNFEGSRRLITLQFQWLIGAHPAHKY